MACFFVSCARLLQPDAPGWVVKVGKHMSVSSSSQNTCNYGSRKIRENGATFVEFAGMAIVAAILVAGVIAVVPSHGRDISCSILSKVSEAIGGGGMQCGVADDKAQEDKHKPTEACTTHQRTQSLKGSVGVAVVSAEIKGSFVVEKLSDGRYRITDTRGLKAGASFGVAGGVEVVANNKGYGAYLGADAFAGGAVEGGVIYEVDSEKAKDDLMGYLTRKAVGDGAGFAGALLNEAVNGVMGYRPPEPTAYYVQAGEEGSASADVAQGIEGAQAEVSAATAIGVKVNRDAGTTTLYYKANADISGNARKLGVGAEASASAEQIVAVTVNSEDPDKVLNVSVTGMYDAQVGATTPLGLGNPRPLESGQVWTASVDLNSAETSRMVRNFLAASKIPGFENGKSTLENLGEATSTFINAAADRGVLTRQDVSMSSSNYGVKVGAKVGLELSAGLGYSDENIEFSNGQYYSGGKWNRWEGC